MPSRPTQKTVPIKLDKARHLKMDFNTLAIIEEKTGKNLLQQDAWEELSATTIRTMVWAMLSWEDSELTLENVGGFIDLSNIEYVSEQLMKVMEFAGKQEGEEKNPQ